MPGVGAIHIDEIEPTLMPLQKALGVDLINNTLGSVGKREFSGDIDVALNIQREQIPEFLERLQKTGLVQDVAQSSVIMTKVKIQNFDKSKSDGRPRTGYVQVDFMPGDPDWMKTYYHSPHEQDSKFKGNIRNILLSTMAAYLDTQISPNTIPDGRPEEVTRYLWGANGLVKIRRTPKPKASGNGYTKANQNEIIGGPWKKPAEIAKIMKMDSPADLDSYETLEAAIRKNYPPETYEQIMQQFHDNEIVQQALGDQS